MFATILLPNFYLQAIARHQPKLRAQPLAVLDDTVIKAVILQLNEAAENEGVRAGMAPSQDTVSSTSSWSLTAQTQGPSGLGCQCSATLPCFRTRRENLFDQSAGIGLISAPFRAGWRRGDCLDERRSGRRDTSSPRPRLGHPRSANIRPTWFLGSCCGLSLIVPNPSPTSPKPKHFSPRSRSKRSSWKLKNKLIRQFSTLR